MTGKARGKEEEDTYAHWKTQNNTEKQDISKTGVC